MTRNYPTGQHSLGALHPWEPFTTNSLHDFGSNVGWEEKFPPGGRLRMSQTTHSSLSHHVAVQVLASCFHFCTRYSFTAHFFYHQLPEESSQFPQEIRLLWSNVNPDHSIWSQLDFLVWMPTSLPELQITNSCPHASPTQPLVLSFLTLPPSYGAYSCPGCLMNSSLPSGLVILSS